MKDNNKKFGIRLSRRQFLFPAVIILAALIIWSMQNMKKEAEQPSTERTYPIMGTMAQVTLYGDKKKTEAAADIIHDQLLEVEKICNIFDPESEISKLNKTAYKKPFKCGSLLWSVLTESRKAYDISEGSFDITAKPLMTLWGFYRKRKELPSHDEIKQALAKTGLNKVVFDDKERTVKFAVPGLSFDLGGIAKGYAVDYAAKAAREFGIKTGIINLAGNMRCFPVPPRGRKNFTLGIRNPLDKKIICGTIDLLGSSVATSGNYERYVTINKQQHTHIMNVKTGEPIKNMLSVTVVTPLALNADILSTSIFINGPEYARKVCSSIPATHALVIRRNPENPEKIETIKIGKIWGDIKF